jgi:hypothetical protein
MDENVAEVLRTSNAFGCNKCGLQECGCAKVEARKPGELCPACRRSEEECICASHAQIWPVACGASGDPLPARTIEQTVNEALNYYYQRDASALARLVRSLLTNNQTKD